MLELYHHPPILGIKVMVQVWLCFRRKLGSSFCQGLNFITQRHLHKWKQGKAGIFLSFLIGFPFLEAAAGKYSCAGSVLGHPLVALGLKQVMMCQQLNLVGHSHSSIPNCWFICRVKQGVKKRPRKVNLKITWSRSLNTSNYISQKNLNA